MSHEPEVGDVIYLNRDYWEDPANWWDDIKIAQELDIAFKRNYSGRGVIEGIDNQRELFSCTFNIHGKRWDMTLFRFMFSVDMKATAKRHEDKQRRWMEEHGIVQLTLFDD